MAFAWLFRTFEDFSALADRPIAEVTHGSDHITFWFKDDTGLRWDVEGDCCSYSWVEHVTIPPGIEGKVITGIKELPVGPDDNTLDDNGYDYIQVYQTSFVTDAGEIILEYRNSSNGYYGGYLTGPTEVTR